MRLASWAARGPASRPAAGPPIGGLEAEADGILAEIAAVEQSFAAGLIGRESWEEWEGEDADE